MLPLLSFMLLMIATNNADFAEAQAKQTHQQHQPTAFTELFTKTQDNPNITVLPNGVKYYVIQEGTGDLASKNDYIRAKYTISMLNGKVVSTSARKNAPPLLEVAALPSGLKEALKQMKVGSHWIIYLPASTAYGDKGYKAIIPANSPLIFDLELISVKNPPDEEVTSVIDEFTEKD